MGYDIRGHITGIYRNYGIEYVMTLLCGHNCFKNTTRMHRFLIHPDAKDISSVIKEFSKTLLPSAAQSRSAGPQE